MTFRSIHIQGYGAYILLNIENGRMGKLTNQQNLMKISNSTIVTGNQTGSGLLIVLTKKSQNVHFDIQNVSVIGNSGTIFGIFVYDLLPEAGYARSSTSIRIRGVTVENIRVDTSNQIFTALKPAAFRNVIISDCIVRNNHRQPLFKARSV